MTITSQAPARVDLAGGTLDIWPLYLFHENTQTINFAIDSYARCRVTPRTDKRIVLRSRDLQVSESFASLDALRRAAPSAQVPKTSARASRARRTAAQGKPRLLLPVLLLREFQPHSGLTLEMESGVPAGSGLGGSSALNIAICGALSGVPSRFHSSELSAGKLVEIARNVESQVLRVPAGEQDYYSAMHGGLQAIHLTAHGILPEKLPVKDDELNERFVLCYTGQSRNSGINNWEVQKAHIDGQRSVIRHFANIARIAAEMRDALIEHDWRSAARLLDEDWQARRRAWPGIATRQIDRLVQLARRNGARAGKACGAGGGGCVAFLVEEGAKERVAAALRAAGAEVLDARLATSGLSVQSE